MSALKLSKAALALADGKIFWGESFGAEAKIDSPIVGEVVFNTSMYGYQEILTDPSYEGQILCFTYPHIGNVGCNVQDIESDKIHVRGVIIRQLSKLVSNFRGTISLSDYLNKENIIGISNIDTRELVTHLRERGAQMGAIASGENINTDDLVSKARAEGSMEGKDYVKEVTTKKSYSWSEGIWSLENGYKQVSSDKLSTRPNVVAIDCGIKYNILRILTEVGFRVTILPATSTEKEILEARPDALFLSNGPGDPATLNYVVNPVKALLGRVPIFGICLGHQILGQALGAETFKLKFGHRGGNHPVKDNSTGKVEITVQNHGFAVNPKKLTNDAVVSHVNLNDLTVEGISVPPLKAFSVQYHPEASPGPHDSRYLFRRFYENVVG